MNKKLLQEHIKKYNVYLEENPLLTKDELSERGLRRMAYNRWSKDRMLEMTREDIYEYFAKLWAMLIWGNKEYIVNKLISDNGLDELKAELAELVWGSKPVAKRWDHFRQSIKGVGPAMMSEILCYVHPDDCMLWSRRVFVGLRYLGVKNLPRHNYQLTGAKYEALIKHVKLIATEMEAAGFKNTNLLDVDYFIWNELQVEENLSQIHSKKEKEAVAPSEIDDKKTSEFIHNEIRDKLADIGRWLGFESEIEKKVAQGSVVDTVWEATIGNMGRVIYVFEVQTKGNIDSLIVNLQQSLNNSAVQGVVAVSDAKQIEKIKKRTATIDGLNKNLKFWDYEDVLNTASHLEAANESINHLGLVPESFF